MTCMIFVDPPSVRRANNGGSVLPAIDTFLADFPLKVRVMTKRKPAAGVWQEATGLLCRICQCGVVQYSGEREEYGRAAEMEKAL